MVAMPLTAGLGPVGNESPSASALSMHCSDAGR